jgi:hypothetical protein
MKTMNCKHEKQSSVSYILRSDRRCILKGLPMSQLTEKFLFLSQLRKVQP